jgi:Ca2+-binding RTX toxin-like protein
LTIQSNGSFTYQPDSTVAGTDSFTYTISDGDGGFATATVTITVTAAAPGSILMITDTHLGGSALLITGTGGGALALRSSAEGVSADDTIVVAPGSSAGTLQVIINGLSTMVAKPSGRIIVIGGDGDDNIQIAGAVTNLVWLYGDAGNDRLNAGNGGSLLLGGDGDDDLKGGGGRDIMIGGQGADKLIGNSNVDILIAGYTAQDDRASSGHEDFWGAVLEEWNGDNAFAARVQNLRDAGFVDKVHDDLSPDAVDFLNGSSGEDWLIFRADEDKVSGQLEATDVTPI